MKTTPEVDLKSEEVGKLTDSELYSLSKIYGNKSRKWQRCFAFLLPEVAKRSLHRKYGCKSIYQFAAKIASVSHEITHRVLALHRKLEDKPLIWNHFKKFGWSKIRVIADVVEIESQQFWLDKLERLPKRALEEYVRIYKNQNSVNEKYIDNLFSLVPLKNQKREEYPSLKAKSLDRLELGDEVSSEVSRIKTFKKIKFYIDNETEFELKKLKQEYEKQQKQSLTLGETLTYLIEELKKNRKEKEPTDAKKHQQFDIKSGSKTTSRYISAKTKEILIKSYRGKCSFPDCNEPFSEFHHSERFALTRNHENVKPLCRVHHQMAHSGLFEGDLRSEYVRSEFEKIDVKVRSYWDTG